MSEATELAKQCGIVAFLTPPGTDEWHGRSDSLERFYALARAKGLEEAADHVETVPEHSSHAQAANMLRGFADLRRMAFGPNVDYADLAR